MIKTEVGISQRAYSRHARISLSYVQKLIASGKIPVLATGRLDPAACDASRERYTRVGRGQRRMGVSQCEEAAGGCVECKGCGDTFRCVDSRNAGTQKFEQFCTPACQADNERGLSRAQVRRRIYREAYA